MDAWEERWEDYYLALEIKVTATEAQIKSAYRQMAKDYHPDTVVTASDAVRKMAEEKFKAANIGFGLHYPIPIHKQPAYGQYNELSLPVCEGLAKTLVSLPMHPNLSEQDVERVCEVIQSL